eukprot:g31773.t1
MEEGLFHVSYEETGTVGPMWVPMAIPFICRKWEELKEKVLRGWGHDRGGVGELAPGLGYLKASAPYLNYSSLIRGFDGEV